MNTKTVDKTKHRHLEHLFQFGFHPGAKQLSGMHAVGTRDPETGKPDVVGMAKTVAHARLFACAPEMALAIEGAVTMAQPVDPSDLTKGFIISHTAFHAMGLVLKKARPEPARIG